MLVDAAMIDGMFVILFAIETLGGVRIGLASMLPSLMT